MDHRRTRLLQRSSNYPQARRAGTDARVELSSGQRSIRLQVMLTSQELKAIDDWHFENRLPNRAAAVREIMRRGMRAADREEDDTVQ